MFTNISMAGTGGLITIISLLLQLFGVQVADGEVAKAVEGVIAAVGIILLVIGQFRRSDLIAGFIRK